MDTNDPLYQLAAKLQAIFMPYYARHRMKAYEQTGELKLAHYTSADAAIKILRTKRIWMRNATIMSDYSEVRHGCEIFERYFSDDRAKAFIAAIDACHPNAATVAIRSFRAWRNANLPAEVYVASLSQHLQEDHKHGRLSMWRAFGGNSPNVAAVINVPKFSGAALTLGIQFSPVAYLTAPEVYGVFDEVIANIGNATSLLKGLSFELVSNYIFQTLICGVTCLKHEGFSEEREWRATYMPKMHLLSQGKYMEYTMETYRDVPQRIYKIPLDESVSPDIAGLELSKILDSVIIGPTQYPEALKGVFVEELQRLGVSNAENRVVISRIPIRT